MPRWLPGAVAVGALPLLLAGCFGASHFEVFQVSIVNDTPQPVVVRDCDSFCSSSPIAVSLQPGESTPINRVAGEHKFFSITSASGTHIGCLDLYYRTPQPGASAAISGAVACPGSGSHRDWRTVTLIGVVIIAVSLASFLLLRRLRLKREAGL